MTVIEANEIYQNILKDGLLSDKEVSAINLLINKSKAVLKYCSMCKHFAYSGENGEGICIFGHNIGTKVYEEDFACDDFDEMQRVVITPDMLEEKCGNCVFYNEKFGECTHYCLRVGPNDRPCVGNSRFRSKYIRR